MHVKAATNIAAPVEQAFEAYADYSRWPEFFTTIRGVHVIDRDDRGVTLGIDHVEGPVRNHLQLLPPNRIVLSEDKRAYRATFVNTFHKSASGTRLVVDARIQLKGARSLLTPVIGVYVRRQMQRLQLRPLKQEAERRLAAGQHGGHHPRAA